MLNKSQLFNYLTLILAICTICFSIWSIVTNSNPIISIVLMFITIIFSNISKKINKSETSLTEEQKEVLKNISNKSEEK